MSVLSRALERGSIRKRATDLAQLHELIAPVSGVRLLDVGGGTGAATQRFATGCAEVVVLEPDRKKVAEGRRLRPSIRFEEGHAEQIPFPDAPLTGSRRWSRFTIWRIRTGPWRRCDAS